jgi:hypothetical protein
MSELDPQAQKRLSAFRAKVEVHLCKYWSSADELKAQVVVGIVHAIRVGPRSGWIRGDSGDTAETLKKLTVALEENSRLEAELKALRESIAVRTDIGGELASGADTVDLRFGSTAHKDWQVVISWDELFKTAGPMMLSDTPEHEIYEPLSRSMARLAARTQANGQLAEKKAETAELDVDDFHKILYQFMALDFVEPVTVVKQTEMFGKPHTEHYSGFRLTKHGARTLGRLGAIKRSG